MTHDGPQDSATANANMVIEPATGDRGFHKFGSSGMTGLIKEKSEHLVCQVHGHCHDGAFVDRIEGGSF